MGDQKRTLIAGRLGKRIRSLGLASFPEYLDKLRIRATGGDQKAVDLSGAAGTMLVCDAVINPPETPLLRAARARGLKTLDGLAMLVYQGVIGFELWTGRKAPEQVMKDALKKALGIG